MGVGVCVGGKGGGDISSSRMCVLDCRMACFWRLTIVSRALDLLVSITVLLYVGNTTVSCMSMHMTRREWDRIAMKPLGDNSGAFAHCR